MGAFLGIGKGAAIVLLGFNEVAPRDFQDSLGTGLMPWPLKAQSPLPILYLGKKVPHSLGPVARIKMLQLLPHLP